jgi:SMC interacting uncharacterized protein involved in chromosome segregation
MAEEKSIIGIIQKMVREGTPEEDIVSTLKELGVEPEQAKRLLLLGQADTFALIRGEIKALVEEEVKKKQPEIQKIIDEEAKKSSKKIETEIKTIAQKQLTEMETNIKQKTSAFQKDIDERVTSAAGLTERTKDKLNELGEAVTKVTLDLDELKVAGVGKRNKLISIILVIAGIAFFLLDIYLFFTHFNAELATDSLITLIVFAVIGTTLLFVATVL